MPAVPSIASIEGALSEAYSHGFIPNDRGEQVPIEPDGVGAHQGAVLRELVATENARRTLEVGFALGLSTLHICAGLLEGGGEDLGHVALDPTEEPHWGNAGLRLVERAGLAGTVRHIPQESQTALPRLLEEHQLFDVAFVDGDHRFDPAFVDIYFCTRLVRPGGLILVDDMWMPAVRVAVSFFTRNVGAELETRTPGSFSFTRPSRWRRGQVPDGVGETAVLRMPAEPVERPWDHFVPFP